MAQTSVWKLSYLLLSGLKSSAKLPFTANALNALVTDDGDLGV